MPNRTSCFSLKNFDISCCVTEALEMKYKTHLSAIFVSSILIVALSPVAVAGNSLILAAIWKRTFARTWFHVLLSGLAFSDFCTGLVVQPILGVGFLLIIARPRLIATNKDLPVYIISTGFLLTSFFFTVALLLLTMLSIECWLLMGRRSLMTHRGRNLTFAVILIVIVSVTVSDTVQFIVLRRIDETLITIFCVMLLLCYLITFFAYFKVYRIIRQHRQQVQSSQNFGRLAINLAKYQRSVNSLLCIFILFSLTLLPVLAAVAILFSTRGNISCLKMFAVHYIAFAICFLSSSLNPALYMWRMNDIRNQVKNLFR